MGSAQNYYDVLDVPQDASAEHIKAAYRALAMIWHPDTSECFDAEERFKGINEAYEILRDPARRAEYDLQLNAEAGSRSASGSDANGGPGSGGASADDADEEPEAFNIRVDPPTIDFGILKTGGPNVKAEVALSWDGGSPYVIRPSPRGSDWWDICGAAPRTGRVTFTASAQAYDGIPNGRQTSYFDILVDDIAHRVELVMTVVDSREARNGRYTRIARRPLILPSKEVIAYRTSWLLATVTVFLFSSYIEEFINPSKSPPKVFTTIAGSWNLAVIIYGLFRTFRRRRFIVILSSKKLWAFTALSIIILAASILFLKFYGASVEAS